METVRNPLRIREGLAVLKDSPLNGNIIGKPQEKLFADELDRAGVVKVGKQRDYSDMGRKWRSCLSQLGFITHKFISKLNNGEKDSSILGVIAGNPDLKLTGLPYEITPSGHRLIQAETLQEQQECMLRTLLAYEIPSAIEPQNGDIAFKPFVFILQVLKKLSALDKPLGLSMVEMSIVQTYRDHNCI